MELSIVESTQKLINDAREQLYKSNKKYYRDALDFLNLLFENNSVKITNIKFTKITLNENVFFVYNAIIDKYKLNKPKFVTEDIDLSDIYDFNAIQQIAYIMANNILEKINYRIQKYTDKSNNNNDDNNHTKFKLRIIN